MGEKKTLENVEANSIKELVVLISYLVKHNESHTAELKDLADNLNDLDLHDAYEDVLDAIKKYDEGNKLLFLALKKVKGE